MRILCFGRRPPYSSVSSRLSLIILAAAYALNGMVKNKLAAFTGAVLYGTSVIYFRHTVFWEFFSDAMLWLPLLVAGA